MEYILALAGMVCIFVMAYGMVVLTILEGVL